MALDGAVFAADVAVNPAPPEAGTVAAGVSAVASLVGPELAEVPGELDARVVDAPSTASAAADV